ncbi:MAG TPA: hypothetical protein VHB47_21225 [Thermoanaerobaculia bacterium]|jgi:hypothetical protein|nr:hypothetical protein [Thermoanaerobaculia bacterium]
MRYPLPRCTLVIAAALLLAAPLAAALAAQAPAGAAPAAANPPTVNPPTTGVTSDPKAVAVADAALAAMGGQAAWDGTHYLRFTFAGRRTHFWDKWTGRHRLEGKTKDNEAYVVLDNVNTHQGTAYMGGKPVEGDKGAKMVENSYGAWINDTYWLLMPYKLKDPGVNLSYLGEQQLEGKDYDEIGLTFGPVGLTPGDHYFAWFNRGTHLMDRWAYLLQDQPRDAAPTVWLWQGWQRYGQIMLAPHRVSPDGQKKLELSEILVAATLPDAVFTSPAPVPPIQAEMRGAPGAGPKAATSGKPRLR